MTGPAGPRRRAAWQAARRAAARRHHPDLGGDPDAYLAALAEVDRRFDAGPTTSPAPGRWVRIRRAVNRQRRRSRSRVRAVRARLPRGMPGAKRYIDLSQDTPRKVST